MKVTLVPGQTELPGLAVMLTLTGRFGFTVIAMLFDVAGLPVAQVSLDVNCTEIRSPLTSVDDVYVEDVSPAIGLAPLNH